MNKFIVTIAAILATGTTGIAVKAQQLQIGNICEIAPHLEQCKPVLKAPIPLPQPIVPGRQPLPIPIPTPIPSPTPAQCNATAACNLLPYAGCATGYACVDETTSTTADRWRCIPSPCTTTETVNDACYVGNQKMPGILDEWGAMSCEHAG